MKYTLIDKRQFFACVSIYLQRYNYMKPGGTMRKDKRKVWTVKLLGKRRYSGNCSCVQELYSLIHPLVID